MDQLKRLEKLLEHKIKQTDSEMNRLMLKGSVGNNDMLSIHELTGKFTAYSEMLIWAINNRNKK